MTEVRAIFWSAVFTPLERTETSTCTNFPKSPPVRVLKRAEARAPGPPARGPHRHCARPWRLGHPLELFDDVAWNTYCPVARLGEHSLIKISRFVPSFRTA